MPRPIALLPSRTDPAHDGARHLPQAVPALMPAATLAPAPAATARPLSAAPGTSPHAAHDTAPGPAPATLPCWPSHALLGRGVEALIRHGDALYRLRLTRQGKLILTK